MKRFKLLSLILAATMSLTIVGCTAKDESERATGKAKDGVYQGTGSGYGGKLTLEVETEGNAIKDIRLVEEHETAPVMNRAFPVIKERIMEAQSPVVDSVSGATFSSFAVKKAVAEAMKEAGKDFGEITMTTQGPAVEKKELEEVKTQLVVVGGGPAGLSAAIEAKQNGVEDIIVVEKLDILSGNGKFDMNFYDLINSQAQRDNGVEDSPEALAADLKEEGAWDTDERLMAQAEGSAELDLC